MSIEAINWALRQAPSVPAEPGKPAPASCRAVLIGLANHADPEGRNAFPSAATLVEYTDLAERTVRACLDRLHETGLIRPSDPRIVAAHIARADRRPQGWDLALERHRGTTPKPGNGVQQPHPAPSNEVHSPHPVEQHEVQPTHPAKANGVQSTTERGAAAAPEPSKNQNYSPTSVVATRAPAHTRARPDLTQLAANALRADTHALIRAWRATHTPPYRSDTYTAVAKHADELLAQGADPTALAAALQAWDRRADARPGLLPWLYDDALKQLRAARAPAASPPPAREKPATGRGAKGRAWLELAAAMEAEAANQGPFRIIDGGRTA